MSRILVVDDEESIRFSYHRFLCDLGHDVTLAERVGEAQSIIEQSEFDVAIVDRVFPDGEDGIELLKYINRKNPLCQVIMITAFPTFDASIRALRSKPFAYLAKPVKKEGLCKTVEEALQKNALEKERLLKAKKEE